MSTATHRAFVAALSGKNERVVQIPHARATFLAQNLNGRAALVAKLTLRPGQSVPDGKGFFVTTGRSGSDNFVSIVSADPGASLLFLKLVDYVLERTAGSLDADDAAGLFVTAINEFRRFTQPRLGRMSEDAIRGLVPELLLLLHMHGGDDGRTWNVFHAWGGPFGALHDFEFAKGNAIEVKSTHRPPSEIRISSIDQTRPLPDGLDLVVLPLEKVSNSSHADLEFVRLVEDVGSLARSYGGDVEELWEAATNALGLDLTDRYYEQWKFVKGDWMRFVVDEDFPRIREANVPQGVIRVSYSLRLDSLNAFAGDFAKIEALCEQ